MKKLISQTVKQFNFFSPDFFIRSFEDKWDFIEKDIIHDPFEGFDANFAFSKAFVTVIFRSQSFFLHYFWFFVKRANACAPISWTFEGDFSTPPEALS